MRWLTAAVAVLACLCVLAVAAFGSLGAAPDADASGDDEQAAREARAVSGQLAVEHMNAVHPFLGCLTTAPRATLTVTTRTRGCDGGETSTLVLRFDDEGGKVRLEEEPFDELTGSRLRRSAERAVDVALARAIATSLASAAAAPAYIDGSSTVDQHAGLSWECEGEHGAPTGGAIEAHNSAFSGAHPSQWMAILREVGWDGSDADDALAAWFARREARVMAEYERALLRWERRRRWSLLPWVEPAGDRPHHPEHENRFRGYAPADGVAAVLHDLEEAWLPAP